MVSDIVIDLTMLDILDHVYNTLVTNKSVIDNVIKKYESQNFLRKIWYGDWQAKGEYPCIAIEPSGTTPSWGATNYTQSNVYDVMITCYIKNVQRPEVIRYIVKFAEIVKRILIHPKNLSFTTIDGLIYDSFVKSVNYSTEVNGVERKAILAYQAVSWKHNVYKT